ncbi:hypothetical protein [Lagierella sp.]|uniref:hypothetical protein n=1 Tax=Lagierella sp. TaxID=2849657 RepID=UPI00260CE077|nr:hypothetical protein [Lagierella sp.]
MKEYKRENNEDIRFSLHDSNIIDLDFDYDRNALILKTQYGYVDIKNNEMVEGDIIIEEVHLEDSYVYLHEYKNVLSGNVGGFVGEKMDLGTFISAFSLKFKSLNVMSEFDSYKTYMLTGFLSRGMDELEVFVEIFYDGNLLYRVRK